MQHQPVLLTGDELVGRITSVASDLTTLIADYEAKFAAYVHTECGEIAIERKRAINAAEEALRRALARNGHQVSAEAYEHNGKRYFAGLWTVCVDAATVPATEYCDACNQPATEDNPLGRCTAYGIETWAHSMGCQS